MLLSWSRDFFKKIEDYPVKFWQILLWFFGVIFLRNFLESLSDAGGFIIDFNSFFLHYPAFYLVVLLGVAIIIHLFVRDDFSKAFKLVFFGTFIILIPPLVDLLVPFWANMSYIQVDSWEMLGRSYLKLGLGGVHHQGASLGMKVELIIFILVSFYYLLARTGNIAKAVFGAVISYIFIITVGLLPSFCRLLYFVFGYSFQYNDFFISLSLVFIALILSIFSFLLWDKKKFVLWLQSINWFRTCLVWLMMAAGLLFYFYWVFDFSRFYSDPFVFVFKFIGGIFVGFFAWQSGRLMNDLADYEFDSASGKKNLLNIFSKEELISLLLVYFIFLFAVSRLVGYEFFIIFLIYLLIGYFYCFEPIHFKKRFLLSSVVLGFDYLLAFLGGFVLFFDASDSLLLLPARLGILVFMFMVVFVGLKDVKDGQGDRLQKVHNLITVFGEKKSAFILAILFLAVLMLPALFFSYWLALAGFIGWIVILFVTDYFSSMDRKWLILILFILYIFSSVVILDYTRPVYSVGEFDLSIDAGRHKQSLNELWFLNSYLYDDAGNTYYWSQTYNPGVGSFLTLIDLATENIYKEYIPDSDNMSFSKKYFNMVHNIPGYSDFNYIKSVNPLDYRVKTSFDFGLSMLNLSSENYDAVLLSNTGEISLIDDGSVNYYALSDFDASGKLLFVGDRVVPVNGQAWIEHLWGDFEVNYDSWLTVSINLDNGDKLSMLVFSYPDNRSLVFGSLFDGRKNQLFKGFQLKSPVFYEGSNNLKWLKEFGIFNSELDINIRLKSAVADQEMVGQNIWDGLMVVEGEVAGESISGWATFRDVRIIK